MFFLALLHCSSLMSCRYLMPVVFVLMSYEVMFVFIFVLKLVQMVPPQAFQLVIFLTDEYTLCSWISSPFFYFPFSFPLFLFTFVIFSLKRIFLFNHTISANCMSVFWFLYICSVPPLWFYGGYFSPWGMVGTFLSQPLPCVFSPFSSTLQHFLTFSAEQFLADWVANIANSFS